MPDPTTEGELILDLASAGELIRLRNRIAALEASGAELLRRTEKAEAELALHVGCRVDVSIGDLRAALDAPKSPTVAPADTPVRSHLFGGGR